MSDPEQLFDPYNAGYVQELFERYSRNPDSVPAEWRDFFSRRAHEATEAGLFIPDALRENGHPPASAPRADTPPAAAERRNGKGAATADPAETAEVERLRNLLPLVARARRLIQAYRDHGHQLARIDPLGSEPPGHPRLDPAFFGMELDDLEGIPTSLVLEENGEESLTETLTRLREIYCGAAGYQFEHLEDPERVFWLREEVESRSHAPELTEEEKRDLLHRLSRVDGLEQFLHRTYLGQKRFSIEGTDMMVPMLDLALEETAQAGGRKLVLGMAHRGRLNVLAHIVGIGYRAILREFEGAPPEAGEDSLTVPEPGSGDVKYHHGAAGRYQLRDGDTVEVELAPNPSHLEFVNPVVEGMARREQFDGPDRDAEQDPEAVVPVLIHGDAAFAAEGVVAETLNLARLGGYATGGTVHIIANNQIGFTTNPDEGRSTRYASDLAQGYDIPIVHVNADDPEACLAAMRLAMAYRKRFKDDFVIDLVGYRRHGHNEGDEPSYTQPDLYQQIAEHPTVRKLWARKLVEDGVLDEQQAKAEADAVTEELRKAQEEVKAEADNESGAFPLPEPEDPEPVEARTAVDPDALQEINTAAFDVPDDFNPHRKLRKQLEKRAEAFESDGILDWAHAEALAFGSLVREGLPVRLTGQDSERGTFSQRHLVLHDEETGRRLTPLADAGRGRFEIYNSPLSEIGVLGFEYGYSVSSDDDFVLWEAQFGDFVNVAQVVVDQFIVSGRTKWGQHSNLTLLLPHGYEGQGPEHSSARLERFLQLAAEDNIRVAFPTTPSQYFHLLRRQALGRPKRPLVVMTPKSLLRHPRATSTPADLAEGTFERVLPDPMVEGAEDRVTRLLLCSGKFYYDLLTSDEREEADWMAVARVEELYPFPDQELTALVERYPNLEEIVWAQEEPRNMGALSYVGARLRAVVPRQIPLRYVARPERASPAEGRAHTHEAKQQKLVADAYKRG